MSRTVKVLIWILIGIPLFLIVSLFIAFQVFVNMASPDHAFGEKPLPLAPDYSVRSNWAGWPDKDSPVERLPLSESPVPFEERPAAAFFLHPTTFGSSETYVQPMDHEETNRDTDLGTISIQATAFNKCCAVYAPRYRQSSLPYPEEGVGEKIFEIGYSDVRNAFLYFLDEIGDTKPFVLASHSQGSFHMLRLVIDEISGTELRDRLIAVYAIGHSLPEEIINNMPDINICESSLALGCFITWDSYRGDREPVEFMQSAGEREPLWNGTDYSGYESTKKICVNPITWTTDASLSKKSDHLGALPASKQDDYGSLEAPLPELVKNDIAVYCGNDESNWLFVNGDRDERLKTQGFFGFLEGNLHGYDYQYYWANIRQNAKDRADHFVLLKDQQ